MDETEEKGSLDLGLGIWKGSWKEVGKMGAVWSICRGWRQDGEIWKGNTQRAKSKRTRGKSESMVLVHWVKFLLKKKSVLYWLLEDIESCPLEW